MRKEVKHRRLIQFKMTFWAITLIVMFLSYTLSWNLLFNICIGAILTSAVIEVIQILFDKLTKRKYV